MPVGGGTPRNVWGDNSGSLSDLTTGLPDWFNMFGTFDTFDTFETSGRFLRFDT